MKKKQIIVVGSGFMAREYLKVLAHLKHSVIVVGRSPDKVALLQADYPQFAYYSGGLDVYLAQSANVVPLYAINAASVNQLQSTSLQLLKAGVKYLLLEKPGALYIEQLKDLLKASKSEKAKVWIAYNRRFYAAVQELEKQVVIDGGILSVNFEFTEWIHTIDPTMYEKEALQKWIISNSSHVIDTVFALIGLPKTLHAQVQGQGSIDWHPSGSLFLGSGISKKGIPFTYHSNWNAPGRWAIEVLTQNRRFYLKPMEKLQVQLKGSVQINEFPIDDQADVAFKAGLLGQVTAFMSHKSLKLVPLEEQIKTHAFYDKIGSY